MDIPGGDSSCPLCLDWIIEFGVYVFMEGGKPEGPKKNSWSVDENQLHVQIIQTQPTVMPGPGIEPGSQWW